MTRRPTVSRLIGLYPCTSPAVYCSTNNGNILEEDMTTPGVSGLKQTFTYDALNRLATATEKNSGGTTTWSETFGYDIYGNRWVSATTPAGLETAFTPTAGSNFNSSNRLLNNGALYDLSGNRVLDRIKLPAGGVARCKYILGWTKHSRRGSVRSNSRRRIGSLSIFERSANKNVFCTYQCSTSLFSQILPRIQSMGK